MHGGRLVRKEALCVSDEFEELPLEEQVWPQAGRLPGAGDFGEFQEIEGGGLIPMVQVDDGSASEVRSSSLSLLLCVLGMDMSGRSVLRRCFYEVL